MRVLVTRKIKLRNHNEAIFERMDFLNNTLITIMAIGVATKKVISDCNNALFTAIVLSCFH